MTDYEKLGAFYLGKRYDIETGTTTEDLILYDSKDLTTHAMCVGMTGSGKTGLCISLLEEAAIDNIPTIAIDPKGDLGNLMLRFPKLRPADFEPWIDPGEASRKAMTIPEYAAVRANLWKKGLKSWQQDGQRIQKLCDTADVNIYTPGSEAGLPISILRSLTAPPQEILNDADALRERIGGTTSGLLALLGIDAPPLQSREHILIAAVIDRAWRANRSLDLPNLIREISDPPFEKLGVFDVESFYPSKNRFELAMSLNNLLASPDFAAWMTGEPLDIAELLHTPEGRPRISILAIAHLSDAERMFFVTILLNEVIAWMRTQPGTGSLRAILYMDEIFGFFPPTANPPSKTPMLTLLKQARAFGLGVVLATQNPVDLDYKGLANMGTWFVGRLQTERDKARLLDGLESASTSSKFDRKKIERTLSSLTSRVFLMKNVHDDGPELLHTRWALSYLRGPLTRQHIQTLMEPFKANRQPQSLPPQTPQPISSSTPSNDELIHLAPPALPPGRSQSCACVTRVIPRDTTVFYKPAVIGRAKLHYVRTSAGVDQYEDVSLLASIDDDTAINPWPESTQIDQPIDAAEEPEEPGQFTELPAAALKKTAQSAWEKSLNTHLYREFPGQVWKCAELKQYSNLNESESEFRVRLKHGLHEHRDLKIEKLRDRYAPKLARLDERIRKARQRVEREKDQVKQQSFQTAISLGQTILGAIFGRKKASRSNLGKAATTLRGAGRTAREKGDVNRAEETVESLRQQAADLQSEFEQEIEELKYAADPAELELEPITIRPKKSDTSIEKCHLIWLPHAKHHDNTIEPLFDI